MTIIVVEGPDNSGKSVLASRLAHDLKALYVKTYKIPPPDRISVHLYDDILFAAERYSHFVVSDRHAVISDTIYAPIVRDKQSPVDNDELIQFCLTQWCVIYCRPPESNLLNFQGREQMDGVIENAKALIQAYDDFFNRWSMQPRRFEKYDYTEMQYDNFLNNVVRPWKNL